MSTAVAIRRGAVAVDPDTAAGIARTLAAHIVLAHRSGIALDPLVHVWRADLEEAAGSAEVPMGSATVPTMDRHAEVVRSWPCTSEVARLLGITERGARKALSSKACPLSGVKVGSDWRYDPKTIEETKAWRGTLSRTERSTDLSRTVPPAA